jgi:hypothetical protein
MKLTMVIEATTEPGFVARLIPLLANEPLDKIIEQPFIAPLIPPLMERHQRSLEMLRQRIDYRDGTVFFDVTDEDLEGYNKFIPYYLFPDCVYSVGLSQSTFRTKVGVGSNPWTRTQRLVNLAKLCERYGGGGHARVGAISFSPDRTDQARKAAQEIVAELRASVRQQQAEASQRQSETRA